MSTPDSPKGICKDGVKRIIRDNVNAHLQSNTTRLEILKIIEDSDDTKVQVQIQGKLASHWIESLTDSPVYVEIPTGLNVGDPITGLTVYIANNLLENLPMHSSKKADLDIRIVEK